MANDEESSIRKKFVEKFDNNFINLLVTDDIDYDTVLKHLWVGFVSGYASGYDECFNDLTKKK